MRRFEDADRLLGNEITAIATDGPAGTYVSNGTEVTQESANEISVTSGTIVIERETIDVTQTVEELDLPEAADGDDTHYRYITVSRDDQGEVVLTNGAVGTIDAEGEISDPVAGLPHPEGNVYLATVLVDESEILDIYDGRFDVNNRLEIDLLRVENIDEIDDLPDTENIDKPTIAYIASGELADDYIGAFQE